MTEQKHGTFYTAALNDLYPLEGTQQEQKTRKFRNSCISGHMGDPSAIQCDYGDRDTLNEIIAGPYPAQPTKEQIEAYIKANDLDNRDRTIPIQAKYCRSGVIPVNYALLQRLYPFISVSMNPRSFSGPGVSSNINLSPHVSDRENHQLDHLLAMSIRDVPNSTRILNLGPHLAAVVPEGGFRRGELSTIAAMSRSGRLPPDLHDKAMVVDSFPDFANNQHVSAMPLIAKKHLVHGVKRKGDKKATNKVVRVPSGLLKGLFNRAEIKPDDPIEQVLRTGKPII